MRGNAESTIIIVVLMVAIFVTPSINAQNVWKEPRKERANSDPKAPLPSNSSSELSAGRFKRVPNDDAFNNLQSRISTLARVVTGVSLYNGLVDQPIAIDNAIAELMNVGSISLKDLWTLDKTKVDDFVTKVTAASKNLKSPGSLQLEKSLVALHELKQIWSKTGDLATVPAKAKFDEMAVMKNLDMKPIEDLKIEETSKALLGKSAAELENMKKNLQAMVTSCDLAKTAIDQKSIKETLEKAAPFHQFAQALEFYAGTDLQNFLSRLDEDVVAMKTEVKSFQGISDKGASLFDTLAAIVSSRTHPSSVDRQLTSGFVNGYLDLKTLTSDLDDSTIKKLSKFVDLKNEFAAISNLHANMKTLDGKWTGLVGATKSIEKARLLETGLSSTKDVTDSLAALLTSYKECPYAAATRLFSVNVQKMSKNVIRVQKKVEAITSISQIIQSNQNVFTEMDTANPSSIEAASGIFERIKPNLQILQSGKSLEEVTDEVLTDTDLFENLATAKANKEYIDMFDCWKTKENLEEAAALSKLAIQLRELNKDNEFKSNIDTALKTVSDSVPAIQSIRTSMENFKQSPKISRLEDLSKFSKQLGDSSALIAKVKTTLEKKSDFFNFIHNGHVVDEAESITDSRGALQTIRENWIHFEDTSVKTNRVLKTIQSWKDQVVKPDDDKLESYGPILESLVGLEDVDLDVESRLVAVETLAGKATDTAVKAKLESLRKSLVALAPLDLTFAQYSVVGMTDVLTGISKVFGGTAPTSTMKPKSNPSNLPDKVKPVKFERTIQGRPPLPTEILIIAILAGIFFAFQLLILLYVLCKKFC